MRKKGSKAITEDPEELLDEDLEAEQDTDPEEDEEETSEVCFDNGRHRWHDMEEYSSEEDSSW